MNSYSIDLSAAAEGFTAPQAVNLRKAIGYAVLFGQNLSLIPNFIRRYQKGDPETGEVDLVNDSTNGSGMLAPVLSFNLDFSLSNIQGFFNTLLYAYQTVYDTTCQSVREYVDKPYAVKGLMAVISGNRAGDTPLADLDNFVSFDVVLQDVDGAFVTKIWVGTCNSSKTDFYTPFKNLENNVTYIDPQATVKAAQMKRA